MLKSTLSVVLSLFLAMSCSCFGETMMPLEKEIETSSPSQAKKILKVTWKHNLNNAPFQVYFDQSEWEYRTEDMAVLDSEIDILTISYLFPWVYVNTVHGDIFPHVFKINGKKFHIIPAHPQQHHHYADFFDLLAKVRMKYELKEWRDNTSPQLINSGSIRARSDIITSPEQELSVSCNELLAWMSSLTPRYFKVSTAASKNHLKPRPRGRYSNSYN